MVFALGIKNHGRSKALGIKAAGFVNSIGIKVPTHINDILKTAVKVSDDISSNDSNLQETEQMNSGSQASSNTIKSNGIEKTHRKHRKHRKH